MACTICSSCRPLASTSAAVLLPAAALTSRALLPSRRTFTSTSRASDQLGWATKGFTQGTKVVDPENLLDPAQQQPFLYDDLPTRAFREYDLDAERLHYRRLIEWQLPELGQKYGQTQPYIPPSEAVMRSTRHEYAFEPTHDGTSLATLTSPIAPFDARLASAAERHKFRLLLDEYFDGDRGVITVKGERFPAFTQNLKWCSDQIEACLKEAQVDPGKFAEVPLRKRKTSSSGKATKISVKFFPAEWMPSRTERRRLEASLRERKEAAAQAAAGELEREPVEREARGRKVDMPSSMDEEDVLEHQGRREVRSQLGQANLFDPSEAPAGPIQRRASVAGRAERDV